MNIDTIIKLLDELRQSAYREGHLDAQIDADYNSYNYPEEMEALLTEGDALEGITNGVYEEIIEALRQLEDEGVRTFLSWDDFLSSYDPIRNDDYGADTDDDGLASFILDKAPNTSPSNIWTVYDLEDGICIMAGWHVLDAVGYIHTTVTWGNADLEIRLD